MNNIHKLGFKVYDCYSIVDSRKSLLDEDDQVLAQHWLRWVLKHTPSWSALVESGPHLAILYGLIIKIQQRLPHGSIDCSIILGDIEYEMDATDDDSEQN